MEATRALLSELKIRATIVNLPMKGPLDADERGVHRALPKLAEDAAFCAAIGCRSLQLVLRATTGGPRRTNAGRSFAAGWRDWGGAARSTMCGSRSNSWVRWSSARAPAAEAAVAGRPACDPNAPPPPPPAPPVPFVWTLPETVKLCEESGPNIGVTLDAWHWYHSGGTVADILATDASRIVHVHVSDARQMPPEEVQDNMRLCRVRASSI